MAKMTTELSEVSPVVASQQIVDTSYKADAIKAFGELGYKAMVGKEMADYRASMEDYKKELYGVLGKEQMAAEAATQLQSVEQQMEEISGLGVPTEAQVGKLEELSKARNDLRAISNAARQGMSPTMIRVNASRLAKEFINRAPGLQQDFVRIAQEELGIDPVTFELKDRMATYESAIQEQAAKEEDFRKFYMQALKEKNYLPVNAANMSAPELAQVYDSVQTSERGYENWKRGNEVFQADLDRLNFSRDEKKRFNTRDMYRSAGDFRNRLMTKIDVETVGIRPDDVKGIEMAERGIMESLQSVFNDIDDRYFDVDKAERDALKKDLEDFATSKLNYLKGTEGKAIGENYISMVQSEEYIRTDKASNGDLTRITMLKKYAGENVAMLNQFVGFVNNVAKSFTDGLVPTLTAPKLSEQAEEVRKGMNNPEFDADLAQRLVPFITKSKTEYESSKTDPSLSKFQNQYALKYIDQVLAAGVDELSESNPQIIADAETVAVNVLTDSIDEITTVGGEISWDGEGIKIDGEIPSVAKRRAEKAMTKIAMFLHKSQGMPTESVLDYIKQQASMKLTERRNVEAPSFSDVMKIKGKERIQTGEGAVFSQSVEGVETPAQGDAEQTNKEPSVVKEFFQWLTPEKMKNLKQSTPEEVADQWIKESQAAREKNKAAKEKMDKTNLGEKQINASRQVVIDLMNVLEESGANYIPGAFGKKPPEKLEPGTYMIDGELVEIQ
jgi:hypothetical protein